MSTLTEIKTNEAWAEYSSTTPSTTLQIIYFKAAWAEPCKQMTTVLETLASSYPLTEPLSTSWISIDAEEVIDVSDLFDVTAVPYIVLRRGADIIETLSGTDTTKVRNAIEKHASNPSAPVAISNLDIKSNLNGPEVKTPESSTHQDPTPEPVKELEDKSDAKEELNKRLASLVKAAPVMLFMKGKPSAPECGFSRQIVELLRENSVKYGFFNILADDEVRQGLKEFADWPTYPQLWIQGELIGGLDILKEELANDPEFLKSRGGSP